MSNSDNVSGLPTLPEGQFWRVGPNYYPSLWADTGTREFVYTPRWYKGPGTTKYAQSGFTIEIMREKIPSEPVWNFFHTKIVGYSEPVYEAIDGRNCYDEPSDETILAAATEIMDHKAIRAKMQENAKAEAFRQQQIKAKYFGDYPPKKLG